MTAQLSSGARVDVLATIRAHAESHRSRAESDAYSAQEAPRLEAALAAVAELVEAVAAVYGEPCYDEDNAGDDPCAPDCMSCRIRAALARMEPQS